MLLKALDGRIAAVVQPMQLRSSLSLFSHALALKPSHHAPPRTDHISPRTQCDFMLYSALNRQDCMSATWCVCCIDRVGGGRREGLSSHRSCSDFYVGGKWELIGKWAIFLRRVSGLKWAFFSDRLSSISVANNTLKL